MNKVKNLVGVLKLIPDIEQDLVLDDKRFKPWALEWDETYCCYRVLDNGGISRAIVIYPDDESNASPLKVSLGVSSFEAGQKGGSSKSDKKVEAAKINIKNAYRAPVTDLARKTRSDNLQKAREARAKKFEEKNKSK